MILFEYACALNIGPLYFPSERGVQRSQACNGSLAGLRTHLPSLSLSYLSSYRFVPFYAFSPFYYSMLLSYSFLSSRSLPSTSPSFSHTIANPLYIHFGILTFITFPPLFLFFITLHLISHPCIPSLLHLTLPSSLDSVTASQDGLEFLEQAEKDYYDHAQGPAQ